jgi:hypothetical protein
MVGIFDFLGPVAPFLQAGASIYGALNQRESDRRQQDLAAQGRAGAERTQEELIALAQQSQQAALAPVVGPYGDRTSYDPETGWRIDPSESTRALLDASRREQLQQYGPDAAMRRDEELRALGRRRDAGALATQLQARLERSPYDLDRTRSNLLEQAGTSVNAAFRDVQDPLIRQATRQGTGLTDSTISTLANARMDALARARGSAEELAPRQYEDLRSARTNRLSSQIQQALNTAGGIPGAIGPTTAGGPLQNTLSARMTGATPAFDASSRTLAYGQGLQGSAIGTQIAQQTPNFMIPSIMLSGAGLFSGPPTSGARERNLRGNTQTTSTGGYSIT